MQVQALRSLGTSSPVLLHSHHPLQIVRHCGLHRHGVHPPWKRRPPVCTEHVLLPSAHANEDRHAGTTVKEEKRAFSTLSVEDESDVEELMEEVQDLETQMKEVVAKYANFEERLDVVERQLLDMARDALVASQEQGDTESESDNEPEADRSPEASKSATATASSRSASPTAPDMGAQGQSSDKGSAALSKEERKQQLVERQLRYMEAADQSTSSTERAGLLGMVAALGDALLNLGPGPSSKEEADMARAFSPTSDGHIQLPPAGSGFRTLEHADMEEALSAGTSILAAEGRADTTQHAQRGSAAGGATAAATASSASRSGGGSGDGHSGPDGGQGSSGAGGGVAVWGADEVRPWVADSCSSSSGGGSGGSGGPSVAAVSSTVGLVRGPEGAPVASNEEVELRIAQARRGGKSIVQAKLQADLEAKDQLEKEEKLEEQRRREVEQGGSMATTMPLQAAGLHEQGYGETSADGAHAPEEAHAATDGRATSHGGAAQQAGEAAPQPSSRQQAGQEFSQGRVDGSGSTEARSAAVAEGEVAGSVNGSNGAQLGVVGKDGAQQGGMQAGGGVEGDRAGGVKEEEDEFKPKAPWWSKERDEEIEEELARRRGVKSVEEPEAQEAKEHEEQENKKEKESSPSKDSPGLLSRSHVYEINRLQSAITEIANSGYIESVKQLRETLLIQEWDLSNRHIAKKRAISMFERYLVEQNLYEEAGGFEVIGALYDDPDSYAELLVSERLRGLARSMMEECMSERRMQVYQSCNATARDIAMRELSGSGLTSLFSMKDGLLGVAKRLWGIVSRIIMPFKFW